MREECHGLGDSLGRWCGVGALLLRCRAQGIQTDSEAKETDIQSLGRAVVGGGVGGYGGHRETSGCRTKTIESGIYFFRDLGRNWEGEVHDRRSYAVQSALKIIGVFTVVANAASAAAADTD